MKLKYIIPSFMAIVAMLVGCNDDYEAAHLDELRVSSSYLALSQDGGSVQFTVNANADWTIEIEKTDDWLTATPTAGTAGETVVTLSAPKVLSARTTTIKVVSGNNVQEVNIVQGKTVAELATCKEVIDGVDGKTYRVRASITQIANAHYGNMYIDDGTGSVYVYGTNDKEGKPSNDPISSWGLEVGDIVTVEGPRLYYEKNKITELVNVTVVKVEKWFVKMIDPETAPVLPKEGGVLNVKMAFKGKGVVPTIADDCTWIHYKTIAITAGVPTAVEPNPADTAVVTFTVDANEELTRKGIVNFMSSNGEASSSVTWEIVQKGLSNPPSGDGTEANPYNVVAALDAAVAGATDVYVKGIVSTAPTSFDPTYGNLSYYISVDGKQEDQLQVFRGFSFNGENFTAQDNIKVGDVVLIKGNLKVHNSQAEFDKDNVLVEINKQTTLDGLDNAGSYRNPFTSAEANAFCKTLGEGKTSEKDYFVKGKIVSYASGGEFGIQYGNASFYISVDGKETSEQFYVFRTLYLGNVKYSDDSWDKPAVGDEVVIYGKLMLYKDNKTGNLVPETSANKSYIYSLNGKTN